MSAAPLSLPPGLCEDQVTSSASDLSYHLIVGGNRGDPLILLLHGFPELAYSWRKIMPAVARAGYFVVAFDQRGYGRTTGWDTRTYDEVDLHSFSLQNLVRDVLVLVKHLGYFEVACIIGHDFGALPASLAALMRPDIFRKVSLLSHPFLGMPDLPTAAEDAEKASESRKPDLRAQLAALPEPRKFYRFYYSGREASKEMSSPQGMNEFLRGYFHLKSGDAHNDPRSIIDMSASELAKLPPYYVMPLESSMRDVVRDGMTPEENRKMQRYSSRWLTDDELAVYVDSFSNIGFQGSLNWYRVTTTPSIMEELDVFAGKKLDVPCLYMVGTKDWLLHQTLNTIERLKAACTDLRDVVLVDGAGHWLQQEQPEKVLEHLLQFLK